MKKSCIVLIVACLALRFSFAYDRNQVANKHILKLPYNLKVINDDAFSCTAAETVILQDNVEYLGNRSFYDNSELSDIYIPQATNYIAENAISDSNVTIHGKEGSLAERWAKNHGFRFIHVDNWIPMKRTKFLLKLRSAYPFIDTIRQLTIVVICLINSIYMRNRKQKKEYPELHAIDLDFP